MRYLLFKSILNHTSKFLQTLYRIINARNIVHNDKDKQNKIVYIFSINSTVNSINDVKKQHKTQNKNNREIFTNG